MHPLTFKQLREANVERDQFSFPESKDWSLERWALKLATETGELCQALEKAPLRYGAGVLADELADIVTVVDLLARKLNIDLGEAVSRKFRIVSERVGSSVFL